MPRPFGNRRAVLLSTDEVTFDLTGNEQGEGYEAFAQRVNAYLRKKAAEIASVGCNVILDWGFWTRLDRENITRYFQERDIPVCWHYIDVPDALWQENIQTRNERVLQGLGGSDFYVDEGLLRKVVSRFEVPERKEIDIWYVPNNR